MINLFLFQNEFLIWNIPLVLNDTSTQYEDELQPTEQMNELQSTVGYTSIIMKTDLQTKFVAI